MKKCNKNSNKQLVFRLRKLYRRMNMLGIDMEYYGGFGEIAEHGQELLGAAKIVRNWADGIDKLTD